MTILRIRRAVRRPSGARRLPAIACATLLALAVHDAASADAANGAATQPTTERADARDKPLATAPTQPVERPVDISDPVIHKAIADSKDLMDDIVSTAPTAFGNQPMTPQQRIDRGFRDAEIPSCLTTEAFRFLPAKIGPFDVGGTPLALPFLVQAITTGKCRH